MNSDDEFLLLSGIQHFAFCRRQWALIHIEQAWAENILTAEGDLLHRRAHDETIRERRGDTLIVRGLTVRSRKLGLVGVCDVVEFHKDKHGHLLFGEDGLWRSVPVEYKRGRSKISDADRLQLCAQAICLEEMLGCDVEVGFLFYGESQSRERVDFGDELRESVSSLSSEMHSMYKRRHTPIVKSFSACRSCSLSELCVAKVVGRSSVEDYIKERFSEESA